MDDDPDFQRDVLEQKVKAIVRDEVKKLLGIKRSNFLGPKIQIEIR